jgi:hypothetical protein
MLQKIAAALVAASMFTAPVIAATATPAAAATTQTVTGGKVKATTVHKVMTPRQHAAKHVRVKHVKHVKRAVAVTHVKHINKSHKPRVSHRAAAHAAKSARR